MKSSQKRQCAVPIFCKRRILPAQKGKEDDDDDDSLNRYSERYDWYSRIRQLQYYIIITIDRLISYPLT